MDGRVPQLPRTIDRNSHGIHSDRPQRRTVDHDKRHPVKARGVLRGQVSRLPPFARGGPDLDLRLHDSAFASHWIFVLDFGRAIDDGEATIAKDWINKAPWSRWPPAIEACEKTAVPAALRPISLHSSQILFTITAYGPFGLRRNGPLADLREPPADESAKGHTDDRTDNTKRKEGATVLRIGAWHLFCLALAVALWTVPFGDFLFWQPSDSQRRRALTKISISVFARPLF